MPCFTICTLFRFAIFAKEVFFIISFMNTSNMCALVTTATFYRIAFCIKSFSTNRAFVLGACFFALLFLSTDSSSLIGVLLLLYYIIAILMVIYYFLSPCRPFISILFLDCPWISLNSVSICQNFVCNFFFV